uniref:rRNA-processing protein UTP23 homolog n=1 Tax=Panagrellus redivivus TaxID=6233 RepID=A0A7E4UU10_PANRE
MPAESKLPKQRLLKFADYLAACTPEATSYGRCVAEKPERLAASACAKEFNALLECFKKARQFRSILEVRSQVTTLHKATMVKVKRAKHSKRVMMFYKFKYGIEPPFTVLLDGTFAQAALKNQINITEQVNNYLHEPCKLVTTACVLKELDTIGKDVYGALRICQQFKSAYCPHRPARSASECIVHLARRSKKPENTKYIVATQDDALLEELRKMGGIPLMSIRFKTIILENPSDESVAEGNKDSELEKAKALKDEILGPKVAPVFKKPKGPKGPNPLSCKKSKKGKAVVGKLGNKKSVEPEKKKTRRKKKTGGTSAVVTVDGSGA